MNFRQLHSTVLRRRKHFEPHGWQTFARALKDTNVPQDLIGHHERWQWMQHPLEVSRASTAASPAAPLRKKEDTCGVNTSPTWGPTKVCILKGAVELI